MWSSSKQHPHLALLGSILLVAGCAVEGEQEQPVPPAPLPAVAEPADASVGERGDDARPGRAPSGLERVERLSGGAEPGSTLPLLVGLHGLGGAPESFARALSGIEVRARIVVPRAPYRYGQGWSWGETSMGAGEGRLRASAGRVAALIEEISSSRPTAGDAVVVGYSQGGCVAYLVAAGHPQSAAAVVPVSGALPPGIRPGEVDDGERLPVIRALHGAADPVTSAIHSRRSVVLLRRGGMDARARVYAGVGHGIEGRMRRDLTRIVEALLTAERRGAPPILPLDCEPCPGRSVDPGACSLCPG